MRFRLATAGGILLLAAASVVGLRPFDHVIDLDGQELDAPLMPSHCRAPVVSAWNPEDKGQVALWAVTVGTDLQGYEVRGGAEPYCVSPARRRLAVAAAIFAAGLLATLVGLRKTCST